MQSVQEKVETVAGAVTDLLQGNPFSTLVGQQIEQATDGSLENENWALNMEICDVVNETDSGPKDAIRAIRKRLQQNMGKNHTVIMYTLTVLETCVKNCGIRFHLLVAHKDFIQELVKLIGPKFDPPQAIQEKVLSLIQCWADAFRSHLELRGVVDVYEELKGKGVDFPMTDLDAMAPIHTPARTVAPTRPVHRTHTAAASDTGSANRTPTRTAVVNVQPAVPVGPVHLTPEQMTKLRSELDVVHTNLTVLRELLSELNPGQESEEDFKFLQDLNATCRSMQQRLVELLGSVADEEVTSQLLLMNDELNNVFEKYNRYMINRDKRSTSIGGATATSTDRSLIDFGAESAAAAESSDLSSRLAAASVGGTSNIDGVPKIAASQSSVSNGYTEASTGQFSGINSAVGEKAKVMFGDSAVLPDSERDLQEVQSWLQAQDSGAKDGDGISKGRPNPFNDESMEKVDPYHLTWGEEHISSPESESAKDFLAQRAAEQSQPQTNTSATSTRHVKSKEEDEQKMFAL